MSEGFVVQGNGILLFHWLAARGVVKLKMVGMKARPGVMREIRAQLGVGNSVKYPELLKLIEAKIAEIKLTIEPGDIR